MSLPPTSRYSGFVQSPLWVLSLELYQFQPSDAQKLRKYKKRGDGTCPLSYGLKRTKKRQKKPHQHKGWYGPSLGRKRQQALLFGSPINTNKVGPNEQSGKEKYSFPLFFCPKHE